jgi:hypothetical protein
MRTIALLAGLALATVLTGMDLAGRSATEVTIAPADQGGTCTNCAVGQPIDDPAITQQTGDGGCCDTQQPNEPAILAELPAILVEPTETTPTPPTVKLADGSRSCTNCPIEQRDAPNIPIAPVLPPVKVSDQSGHCANCAVEEPRQQQHPPQSNRLKQRHSQQAHSSEPARSRHAAHRSGPRQQSLPSDNFPFQVEIRHALIDAEAIAGGDQ